MYMYKERIDTGDFPVSCHCRVTVTRVDYGARTKDLW